MLDDPTMLLAYSARSLRARWMIIGPTLLAAAGTVAATVVMMAIVEGMFATIDHSGVPLNAVVLARGAVVDAASRVEPSTVNQLSLLPELARMSDGQPGLSAEVLSGVQLKHGHAIDFVRVRGLEPRGWDLHGAKLIAGKVPDRGTEGLVVGKRRAANDPRLAMGESIRVGRHRWPVVGIFDTSGTVLESELWADRTALAEALNGQPAALVIARAAKDPAELAKAIDRLPGRPVESITEPAYYRLRMEGLTLYTDLFIALSVVLVVGASLACTNAMYTTVLGRVQEFAVLRTIGFTRAQVAGLVLTESLLLSVLGTVVGLAASSLVHGRELSSTELDLYFTALVSARVAGVGALVGLTIGLFSSTAAIVRVTRISLLQALSSV
jgi:putative ABC transport system permease protein